MSTTQETVKAAIESTGPTTTAALVKYTGISRTSVTRAINKLATARVIETLPDVAPIEWVVAEAPAAKEEDKSFPIPVKVESARNIEDIYGPILETKPSTVNLEDITAGEDPGWHSAKAGASKLPDDIEAAFAAIEEAYNPKPAVIDDMEIKQLVLARLAAIFDPSIARVLHQIGDDLLALSGKQQ